MSDLTCKPEDEIKSTKGHKLFCRYWSEDAKGVAGSTLEEKNSSKPKALVMLVHGFAEHCKSFDYIAQTLASQGYYLFGHDHVGHGKSEGDRAQIYNFSEYVNDLFCHAEAVKKRFPPEIPFFAIGHSMGGTVTVKAALERPDFFQGIVLISPLILADKKVATPTRITIGKLVSRIFPNLHLGQIDSKSLSRNEDYVKQYNEDPHVYHTGVKSKLAMVLNDVLSELPVKMADITWPFLVLHGDKDSVCDIEGSKLLHEKAKSADKEIKIFPDAFHQLHNDIEPTRSETCNAVADWINARC